jgi:hypothetical protein
MPLSDSPRLRPKLAEYPADVVRAQLLQNLCVSQRWV